MKTWVDNEKIRKFLNNNANKQFTLVELFKFLNIEYNLENERSIENFLVNFMGCKLNRMHSVTFYCYEFLTTTDFARLNNLKYYLTFPETAKIIGGIISVNSKWPKVHSIESKYPSQYTDNQKMYPLSFLKTQMELLEELCDVLLEESN
jgi:hypothetical protein